MKSEEALCNFGEGIQTQNLNIYNINEVIMQTQHSLKLEGRQGQPNMNKVKLTSLYSIIKMKREIFKA